jgi:hypothetical protein
MSAITQHYFYLFVKKFIFRRFKKIRLYNIFFYRTSLDDMLVDNLKYPVLINLAIKVRPCAVHDFNQWLAVAHAYATGFLQFEVQIFGFFQCLDFVVGLAGPGCDAATAQSYNYLCFTHIS